MMRMAIVTKYLPVTNTRQSRVKATAERGSIVLNWDNALDTRGNHTAAAVALCRKFDWTGTLHCGGLPGAGYVFVFECDEIDAVIVS